ncbi:hypothetical protein [Phytohabitans houttuyneae]|uniref:DUF4878 domain-containing protein n=1 Tax=Phytohabitans houttuyneae TaxID=1076126 RepID=A0A6V8K2G8_9ACTN|nr:hypothetical protein [Phytohabitans houttuyneae]GFJ76156.1 hypothetical protein Phou_003360 [Phytohabitans houttuyneae]
MTASPRRGRAVFVGAAIAAVVAVTGCLGYVWQRTDPAEGAARNYLKALAADDAELACTLVTEPFARELATRHSVGDCPAGVDAMLGGLSGEQRERVGDARLTPSDDGHALAVGANPLGITILRVDKAGEEWMVSGDR